MTYTLFDVALLSQKLVLCLLPHLGLDAYGSLIVSLVHTIAVFMLWLRLRPHSEPHLRQIALLMFSCVLGLQVYCLVAATRWDASLVSRSPTSVWRFGFNVTMFCYVVGCIGYCLSSVVRSAVKIMHGPRIARRSLRTTPKSSMNSRTWVNELDGYAKSRTQKPPALQMPPTQRKVVYVTITPRVDPLPIA